MNRKKIKCLCFSFVCSILCACANSNMEITDTSSEAVEIGKPETNEVKDAELVDNIEYMLHFTADEYDIKDENFNDFYVEDLNVKNSISYQELYETFDDDELPNEEVVYENEHFTIVFGIIPGYESLPKILTIESKGDLENDWRESVSKDLNLPYYEVVRCVERYDMEEYNLDDSDFVLYRVDFQGECDDAIFENIVIPDNLPFLSNSSFFLQYKESEYCFMSDKLGYTITETLENAGTVQEGIEKYQEDVKNNIEDIKGDIRAESLLLYSEWETINVSYLDEFGLVKFENDNATIYAAPSGSVSQSVYAEYYDENIKRIADNLGISTWVLDIHSYLARNDDIIYFDEDKVQHYYERETGEEREPDST